jgi:hypothetical protein
LSANCLPTIRPETICLLTSHPSIDHHAFLHAQALLTNTNNIKTQPCLEPVATRLRVGEVKGKFALKSLLDNGGTGHIIS